MKHIISLTLLILLSNLSSAQSVKTGIEVLRDSNFSSLKGKRVGLITNPTGVDSKLNSTIDILFGASGVKLVALFSPEHGVRGDVHAGDKVSTYKDPKTGVTVYSLFGANRTPSKEVMDKIDIIVYDIQDIGARSYTFISTMGEMMSAAGKYGKEFMVLDRPNPIGGNKIEGCLVDEGYFSFVSKFKIPYLYGMTPGELAKFLVGEKMIPNAPKLTVIPMSGWSRDMDFTATGLPWIAPSPHIPTPLTAYYCPATGILGELGVVSVGVGYTMPFQLVATENIDALKLSDNLNSLKLHGVHFRPIYIKPFYSFGAGKNLNGVQIHLTDPQKARLTDIQFVIMQEMYRLDPTLDFFKKVASPSRVDMWNKVSGTGYLSREFGKSYDYSKIKAYWQKDEESFRNLSKKYYLYK